MWGRISCVWFGVSVVCVCKLVSGRGGGGMYVWMDVCVVCMIAYTRMNVCICAPMSLFHIKFEKRHVYVHLYLCLYLHPNMNQCLCLRNRICPNMSVWIHNNTDLKTSVCMRVPPSKAAAILKFPRVPTGGLRSPEILLQPWELRGQEPHDDLVEAGQLLLWPSNFSYCLCLALLFFSLEMSLWFSFLSLSLCLCYCHIFPSFFFLDISQLSLYFIIFSLFL